MMRQPPVLRRRGDRSGPAQQPIPPALMPGQRAIDTIVRDPTKPVGYAYRNNGPVDGAQVWVTVTIYDHGKLHWTKRYYSNYPAVNGVLVVGSG